MSHLERYVYYYCYNLEIHFFEKILLYIANVRQYVSICLPNYEFRFFIFCLSYHYGVQFRTPLTYSTLEIIFSVTEGVGRNRKVFDKICPGHNMVVEDSNLYFCVYFLIDQHHDFSYDWKIIYLSIIF